MRSCLFTVSLFATSIVTPALADVVIHAGKVITASDNNVRDNMTIVVKDKTIASIESGFIPAKSGDTLIDLRDGTVMPGLMDMHTHITSQHNGPASYMERFSLNEADYALKGVGYANKTLMAGFTTVRNLGDGYNETIALRNAINKGQIVGPRIYTAGKSIATTGGHADRSNGLSDSLAPVMTPADGVINGDSQARQAVRQR